MAEGKVEKKKGFLESIFGGNEEQPAKPKSGKFAWKGQ